MLIETHSFPVSGLSTPASGEVEETVERDEHTSEATLLEAG